MIIWNRLFPKGKETGSAKAKISADDPDSEEEDLTSPDLPEWLGSSGSFTALRSYFGDRIHGLGFSIGSDYPREVGLIFLAGNTDGELVDEFSRRIRSIHVDWLEGVDHLIRLTEEDPDPVFPKSQKTMKPEPAAIALQRGQIILVLKDNPMLVIAPAPFLHFFQTPGSNWRRWPSPGHVLRVCAFASAVFLPAIYMAIISYQYYALPLKLFFLLAESRAKAPFPPLVEVLLIEALLEIFREGAARINMTAGIVIGAFGGVLAAAGIAAAGWVTPAAALFCGAAQLAALVLPARDLLPVIRKLKLAGIIMTASFGILGTVVTAASIMAHLVGLGLSGWPYIQIGKRLKRT